MWGWVVRDGPPLMEMEWVRVKDSPLPGDVALVSARVKVVLEGAGFSSPVGPIGTGVGNFHSFGIHLSYDLPRTLVGIGAGTSLYEIGMG